MSETDAEFVDRLVGRVKGGDIVYVLVVSSREEQTRLLSLARRGAESADTITALRAEVAWHVEDKNKWQDTQAAHLREVTRLTARVKELEGALERIDRIEVYDEDARETLRAKLGVMRDIARAARKGK